MGVRIALALCLLAMGVDARDKKAAQLASQAVQLSKQGEADWKKFILERATFTDAQVSALIDLYEQAAEMFHESMEIEEHPGLNGQVVLLARRLAKLRFEQVRRQAARAPKPAPKPRPKPKSKPKPEPKPSEPEAKPESAPESKPAPEVEPEREAEPSPWPELIEDKKAQRRGIQTLRNFLMHYYFANRKFSSLILRCTRCNGHRKIVTGRDQKTRKPIFADCPACNASGAHLNVNNARKAFWLTMSPLYRADAKNREEFSAKLAAWREDPRKVPEFSKSLSIRSIDYRGLWAVVKFTEKVVVKNRTYRRDSQRTFLRQGKRWFVYDEKADKDFFSPDVDEEAPG